VFKTTIFESRKITQRISQLKNCISEIATKTESLKAQLNAERLSNRLKERQSSLPSKNMSERKMSVSKLVDAARTRSRMFGEPYTKSFSIVKKQNI
jgi:phage shock protein A